MARLITRTFDPSRPVFVRRAFPSNGRHYKPGDLFDWRRQSIAQRRVQQLFDNGKLLHKEEIAEHGSDEMRRNMRASVEPPKTIADEVEDEDILATAAAVEAAPVAPEPESEPEPTDDLDDLDMKALRAIALEIGAPSRVSRAEQRAAIREARARRAG